MTDRPILFSGRMVRALLEGGKTQTRRVLKPRPPAGAELVGIYAPGLTAVFEVLTQRGPDYTVRLPYTPGHRLWVRETHAVVPSTAYRMSEGVQQTVNPDDPDMAAVYAAGWERSKPQWRPSIHVPRWASRLTLAVTDVRVQRLQEIDEADAVAEGCPGRLGPNPDFPDEWDPSPVEEFRSLWDGLNAGRGFGWEANPWVVAVTFDVQQRNIDHD